MTFNFKVMKNLIKGKINDKYLANRFWNWRWFEFWNCRRISKCLFTFLCFIGSKRRTNCSAMFLLKSPNLEGASNTFQRNIKKHNKKNISIFDTNFNIRSKCHDPCLKSNPELFHEICCLPLKNKSVPVYFPNVHFSICHFVTFVIKTILTKLKQTIHLVNTQYVNIAKCQ